MKPPPPVTSSCTAASTPSRLRSKRSTIAARATIAPDRGASVRRIATSACRPRLSHGAQFGRPGRRYPCAPCLPARAQRHRLRTRASSSPAEPASSARTSSKRSSPAVERVVVLDDLSTGDRANFDALRRTGASSSSRAPRSTRSSSTGSSRDADVCFHLASAVGVQLVVSNPLDSLLKQRPRHRQRHVARPRATASALLFTSTSEVYGKNSSGALDEDSDRMLGSPVQGALGYAIVEGASASALAHSLPPRAAARR